ncbi:MAG: hypothetical protein ACK4S2_08910 [Gemmobacter sp.]|uniref:hypothetical protein n=1 Tax=Gemmobacter sp. TaxID=1898957 RepID=UPI00391CF804
MRVVLLVLLLVWPLAVAAGPWPRAAGERFVSLSAAGQTGSAWFEQGLGRGRWLVAEAQASRAGDWALALRLHRALPEQGSWRLAWSLGLSVAMPPSDLTIDLPPVWWPGRTEVTVTLRPVVAAQAGLSLGRGVGGRWPGWLAFDLVAEAGPQRKRLKADATLGLAPSDRWTLMLQAHARLGTGPPALALAPSVVWQARRGLRLQAGLHHDLRARKARLQLATWAEF